MPSVDSSLSTDLNEIRINSVGGTVNWVENARYELDLNTLNPRIDSTGQPIIVHDTRKVFQGVEDFVFLGNSVTLKPEASLNHVFSHWSVDNITTLPDGIRFTAGVGSMILGGAKNGIIFDNRTFPRRQRQFLHLLFWTLLNLIRLVEQKYLATHHGRKERFEFSINSESDGSLHHFTLDENGSLKLAEDLQQSGIHNLKIRVLQASQLLQDKEVTVNVTLPLKESFLDVNTSDSAYHESALMIREPNVVKDNWRNWHNPITGIGSISGKPGLFVTTAQPHGRKLGDSVVLSGVLGLKIKDLKNWNFIIDEVTEKTFRIRHFGKDGQGRVDGTLGPLAAVLPGTSYNPNPRIIYLDRNIRSSARKYGWWWMIQ